MKITDEAFETAAFLKQHRVSPTLGFLPDVQPLRSLPYDKYPYFQEYQEILDNLGGLNMTGKLRLKVDKLTRPASDEIDSILNDLKSKLSNLQVQLEVERMFHTLCFIGNSYAMGNPAMGQSAALKLPKPFSVFWYGLGQLLERPVIVNHPSTVLFNWKLIEQNGPVITEADISIDNVTCINTFGNGMDEDWFFSTTVVMEAKAAKGIKACVEALRSVVEGDTSKLLLSLQSITESLNNITAVLGHMKDQNDPYIFYNRVRWFLQGWKNNKDLFPNGLIYEGCNNDEPIQHSGGSAAQSGIFHVFDSIFKIQHKDEFIKQMRSYMVKQHREFVEHIEATAQTISIADFVQSKNLRKLIEAYDGCIAALQAFRTSHIAIVTRYVVMQSKKANEQGTGGSNLIPFLKEVRSECDEVYIQKKKEENK